MTVRSEVTGDIEPNPSYRSYFAFIPIFKRRIKTNTEKSIVRLIHKSSIFKSNPILKTILIENVRICCIVVESSGEQSVKILCASAPYILSLISKANPKFANFLKNEKVSSCVKYFREHDFENLLNGVYHTTIILHNGVKKLYSTVYVSFIKDSIPNSEKLLLYLLKLILHVLQSAAEFLYENFTTLFQYFYQQNYRLFTYVADNLPVLISSFIKYVIIATENTHETIFLGARCMKKLVLTLYRFLNDYSESALYYWLKKLYLFLKLCLFYLRATDTYRYIGEICLRLFHILKPHLLKYCVKLFDAFKQLVQNSIPFIKDTIPIIVKETISYLQKFLEENWERILNLYKATQSFLFENIHYIKPFCCSTCHILYDSICYTYDILQAVLPHVIHFSSNTVIFFATTLTYILEQCVYFCKIIFCHILTLFENKRQHFCRLSKIAINILKDVCEVISKIQPYMVLISRAVFDALLNVIHVISPTLIACTHEINSSLFYASKEVVGKSCLAVKRVTPSFYYSIQKVMPPTLFAIHELLKSSKNSVVIISPAVLKFVLKIRPEIQEGFIILFSDGNKACIEIITVSCLASCEIKNAAVIVLSNIPVICKAVHEVVITTACATVEVTNKSLSAKSRMLKDIKRAHRVLQTSFVLAEQEVVTVYNDFICEVDTFFPTSKLSDVNRAASLGKYTVKLFHRVSSNLIKGIKITANKLDGLGQKSIAYTKNFSKLFANAIFSIFFLAYVASMDLIKTGVPKINKHQKNFFIFVLHISAKISYIISSKMCFLGYHTRNCISNSNIRIMQCALVCIPEAWFTFKSNVGSMWTKICLLAPELWILIEHSASVLWNLIVEYTPSGWNTWKRFCLKLWKLTHDSTPHLWQYSVITISVLWPYGRAFTKHTWCLFISTSGAAWKHSTLFTSEYWLLSKTYLPRLWLTSCKETKTTWIATCYLIENCYSITVESCFQSWNFLQYTVAKSWRSGVVFTKTAYYMFNATGSVLQRSFCMCSKTKRYVSVILKSTPLINDIPLHSFRIPKLQRVSYFLGKHKLC